MSGVYLAALTLTGATLGLATTWAVERKNSPSDERRTLGKLLIVLSGVEICLFLLSGSDGGFTLLRAAVGGGCVALTFGGAGWLLGGGYSLTSAAVLVACAVVCSRGVEPLGGWALCLGLSLPLVTQGLIQRSLDSSWGRLPTLKSFDWFITLTGCNEEQFRKHPENYIKQDPRTTADATIPKPATTTTSMSDLSIVNPTTKQVFHAGQFSLVPLGELRREMLPREGPRRNVPIELVCKSPADRKDSRPEAEWRRELDVAAQQSDPKYRNAVFQVASNFNAIEALKESSVPESPDFARNYYSDLTQGPSACIGAGPGAITRLYAPFFDPLKPASEWGQTSTRQVNFLAELPEYFPVQNGYVVLTKSKDEKDQGGPRVDAAVSLPSDEKELSLLEDKVLVAYHHQIQVTSGHRPRGNDYAELVQDETQCVDQVLCAALNIGQGLEGRFNRMSPDAEIKAKFLLRVAYEGAYLAAIRHNRTQLCLTLIGGGVFNTPHNWIIEAIVAAHLQWGQHGASSLQRVVINLHTNAYLLDPVRKMLEEHHITSPR